MARFRAVGLAHLRHPAAARQPAGQRRLAIATSFYSCGMLDSPGTAPAPGLLPSGAVPGQGGPARWLKPLVSVSLYAFIFWFTDVRAILARLADARFEYVAAGVLLYAAGQALSTWKWRLLLAPVGLGAVRYTRLLAFYFIGMFFNLFLPTIVGGDAVKAVLLARETGSAGPRDDSVFMERNLGLFALLSIALVAAWRAPAVDLMGVTLSTLTVLLFAASSPSTWCSRPAACTGWPIG